MKWPGGQNLKIDALPIARELWEQTRPKSALADRHRNENEDAAKKAPTEN